MFCTLIIFGRQGLGQGMVRPGFQFPPPNQNQVGLFNQYPAQFQPQYILPPPQQQQLQPQPPLQQQQQPQQPQQQQQQLSTTMATTKQTTTTTTTTTKETTTSISEVRKNLSVKLYNCLGSRPKQTYILSGHVR